jgi:hypothetical protein
MALVKAIFSALDMSNLNLGFFNSNISEVVTTLDENNAVTGNTYVSDWPDFEYPDVFSIQSTTSSADLAIEFLGSFTEGIDNFPSSGIVGFIGLYDFNGGTSGDELVTNYVILDISVPINDILSAINTNVNADDLDLFLEIFSGDDQFYLSDFEDSVFAHDGDDTIYGYDGDDELHGNAGADFIFGDAGDDEIFGDSGIDTAGFAGNRAAYTITKVGAGTFTISGPDGADTLHGVEYALFDDETVQLNLLEPGGALGRGMLFLNPGNQSYGPVPGGDLTNVFGSNLAERITLAADANVILDPSFVRGNDVIIVDGASSDYKISANVAGLTISSTNGAQIRFPSFGTGGGLQVQFSDGAAEFDTDDGGSSFRLVGFSGVQEITGSAVAINSSVLTFA